MSMDIIAPRTIPSTTLDDSPIAFNPLVKEVFRIDTGGFTRNVIMAPMRSTPSNGYISTGFIPSKLFGNFENNFFKNTIKYPAIKPARRAPKNPDPPLFAIAPPTKPVTSAGLSPILIAMYPARIGNIKPNAVSPIVFRKAANGVFEPNVLAPRLASSNRNARAINIPPPITNGSI